MVQTIDKCFGKDYATVPKTHKPEPYEGKKMLDIYTGFGDPTVEKVVTLWDPNYLSERLEKELIHGTTKEVVDEDPIQKPTLWDKGVYNILSDPFSITNIKDLVKKR